MAKSIELFISRRRLGVTLSEIHKERSLADAAARAGNGRGILPALIMPGVKPQSPGRPFRATV